MPTFLILKNGKVSNTLRGADPSALRAAVLAASDDASRGSAQSSAAFQSKGQVLGNKPAANPPTRSASSGLRPGAGATVAAGGAGINATFNEYARAALRPSPLSGVVRFIGLYFTTLLTLDPHGAAASSVFNQANTR